MTSRTIRERCSRTFLVVALVYSAIAASAQTSVAIEPLPNNPIGYIGPLVQAPDGTLLGTVLPNYPEIPGHPFGGIFRVTVDGRNTTIHDFSGRDGYLYESWPLLVGTDGNVYGVTNSGGPTYTRQHGGGCGTAFRVTPSGEFTTIHAFSCPETPRGGLVEGADGYLYGVADGGLRACGPFRLETCGVIYRFGVDGGLSTVHQFGPAGGWFPSDELVAVGDAFYGLTRLGGGTACGGRGCGTVFRLGRDGTVTTVATFPDVDRGRPEPFNLVYNSDDGALYGATAHAVACTPVTFDTDCGAVFRVTSTGQLTTVFAFDGTSRGRRASALTIGLDGQLYGVTPFGGREFNGTVFRLTREGILTTLYEFRGGGLGVYPFTLARGMDGDFFGTTPNCARAPIFESTCKRIFRIALHDDPVIANLQVSGLRAPNAAEAGATITLSDTVRYANYLSSERSPVSSTKYWLLPPGAAYGTTVLGVRAVPQLRHGEASTGAITAVVPSEPGVYTLLAQADGDHQLREWFEYENARARTLVVGPDLRIRKLGPSGGPGIELQPPQPTSTTETTIKVYTANVGAGTPGTSVTRLYMSKTGKLSDAVLIAEFDIGRPERYEHDHRAVSVILPPGDYFLLAVADANGQVAEAVENNLVKLRVSVPLDLTSHLVPDGGVLGSVTTGPDGAAWFTMSRCDDPSCDGTHHDFIARVSADGVMTEFPLPFNPIAVGAGTFGLTTGPDNALWFTEIRGNAIGRITTDGTLTRYPLPAPHESPYLITAGPDGALWFTESRGIGRITVEGDLTFYPLSGSQDAVDIVTGPDGALWFTGLGGAFLGRITTQGAITKYRVPFDCGPLRLTSGPDGALWFTCLLGNKIGRLTIDGVISTYPVPTKQSGVADITPGSDGALWFTEQNVQKIGRITTDGSITEFPAGPHSYVPHDMTTTPSGIWIADVNYIRHIRLPGDVHRTTETR